MPDLPPSAWVQRHAALLPRGLPVLDMACGGGRHTRLLHALGHAVVALDRDPALLRPLQDCAQVLEHDLESQPWPFAEASFGGIVVTNYLWRPLLERLPPTLAPGGVLIYETFGVDQASLGKPSNPDYLLRPGELLDALRPQLRVIAFEDGYVESPRPAFVQRVCAVRSSYAGEGGPTPARYNLQF